MESQDEDEDVKLVKASDSLLSQLEVALPRILWKQSHGNGGVHKTVKPRDLENITKLIEPFQGEPQLLDPKLKRVLPPVVDAFLEYAQLPRRSPLSHHFDLQTAVCSILYTLCKVRGHKVITGFFNNEAKNFETILSALERSVYDEPLHQTTWQVQYITSLWLSHLLLAPFDLASISDEPPRAGCEELNGRLPESAPPLAIRVCVVGWRLLASTTKAQDGAAAVLVRLVSRPDMQRVRLADVLTAQALSRLQSFPPREQIAVYPQIGSLRFLRGVACSEELGHLFPDIYQAGSRAANDESDTAIARNAVAKKLLIKIMRSIVLLALRLTSAERVFLTFLETTNVVEDVVEQLLRSLCDKDTPVRQAAAKATSLIILELDPALGHEVIQAVLDMFKEDLSRESAALDFRTADPLKWHGLTLTLAYVLFNRSASPSQLGEILDSLLSALQFTQQIATGSSLGTNVRDAANFGIWSLARRYTTKELLSVSLSSVSAAGKLDVSTVIRIMAVQLLLSACLDPSGNIRRGSSAGLQELVGRHPDQVEEGIALVQIVDYQAVGLRRRAMIEVTFKAADLSPIYWNYFFETLFGWRGLEAFDVSSREAAAESLARLCVCKHAHSIDTILSKAVTIMRGLPSNDIETLHGLSLSAAKIIDVAISRATTARIDVQSLWAILEILMTALRAFNARNLRAELPAACAQLIAALCRLRVSNYDGLKCWPSMPLDELANRILRRHEDTVLTVVPDMVQAMFAMGCGVGERLDSIDVRTLSKSIISESSGRTLTGAGRAIALGALGARYEDTLGGKDAAVAVETLAGLMGVPSVEWRTIGIRGLNLAVNAGSDDKLISADVVRCIADAVHRGMIDYTIDERGDVGSLVRLEAISCTSTTFTHLAAFRKDDSLRRLEADVLRLSLEKLDRVRVKAAECRANYLGMGGSISDAGSVSSFDYFMHTMAPLKDAYLVPAELEAILEGCISSCGVSAEPLLQASRAALVTILGELGDDVLRTIMETYSSILKKQVTEGTSPHAALELLAFLFDMRIPQRLAHADFRWRNLLTRVQSSHYKSNDVPRLLAAIHTYHGLGEVQAIRGEVLQKLGSMLKTNPFPRVRSGVAESLWLLTKDDEVKVTDWTRPLKENVLVVNRIMRDHVATVRG